MNLFAGAFARNCRHRFSEVKRRAARVPNGRADGAVVVASWNGVAEPYKSRFQFVPSSGEGNSCSAEVLGVGGAVAARIERPIRFAALASGAGDALSKGGRVTQSLEPRRNRERDVEFRRVARFGRRKHFLQVVLEPSRRQFNLAKPEPNAARVLFLREARQQFAPAPEFEAHGHTPRPRGGLPLRHTVVPLLAKALLVRDSGVGQVDREANGVARQPRVLLKGGIDGFVELLPL